MDAGKPFEKLEQENRLLRDQIKAAQNRFEEKIEELSLIRELGMGLLSVHDFEGACAFITETIINNTVAQNCSIMLLDRQENRLFLARETDLESNRYTVQAKDIYSKKSLHYSFKIGEGPAGRVMADKKPIVIHDMGRSRDFDAGQRSRIATGSLLVVPLLVKDEPIGVLNLSHSEPHVFSAADISILSIIANYVATSIQNTLNYEELNLEVSRRRRVEAALRKAHEDLEIRIDERTAELAEANEQLRNEITERKAAQAEAFAAKERAEHANRTKSEFLANMSHELRTPLNHIIGFTELVVGSHFGELNERQKSFLTDVLHSSRHLLSLINDILDLSKVEAGKLELDLSDANLKELLINSLIMVKEKSLKHGITLETAINELPDEVIIDERKMKQILYNLLSNAVKFTPNGGRVVLGVRAVRGVLGSGHRRHDPKEMKVFEPFSKTGSDTDVPSRQYIEVSVSDTGIGIKKEDQSRIFNAFEQVDGTKTRHFEGTGLGLSLTKKLIELHGGMIWVESDGENKGSTFRFIVPIDKDGAASAPRRPDGRNSNLKSAYSAKPAYPASAAS